MNWPKTFYKWCNSITTRQFLYAIIPLTVIAFAFYLSVPHIPNTTAVWGTSMLEHVKTFGYIVFAIRLYELWRVHRIFAFKIFFFATLAWMPGQLIQSITPFTENTPYIYSNSADIFLILAVGLIVPGILMLGLHGLSKRERTQILVHAVTFGSCVAFAATIFVTKVWLNDEEDLIRAYLPDYFSLSLDLILISVCLALALYRRKDTIVAFICTGLFFQCGADLLYLASAFQGLDSSRPVQRMFIWVALMCWISSSFVKNPVPSHAGNVRSEMTLAMGSYIAVALVIVFGFTQARSTSDVADVIIYSFLFTFVAILVAQIIGFFDNKRLVSAQQQSIEEISESEERYQDLATHDTLTHLSNRTYFIEQLSESLRSLTKEQPPLAVMFIDLDRFKEINDTYGHSKGDDVIKTVAQRITDVVGDNGIVCRLGGDEFAILIPSPAHREPLVDLANKLLEEVIAPIDLAGQETYLTCSVGIALSSDDERDPQVLLRNADTAMYRAKELGRNRIEFADGFIKPVPQMTGWSLSDLHRGVAQKEIDVYYQPIIDMSSNKISGYEALARWEHPRFGAIGPDEFIPVAEDNGLIIELGDQILQQSIRQLHQWDLDSGSNFLTMHINLSLRQLNDESFLNDLLHYCEENSVLPHRIHFEMTESSLLGDVRSAMAVLREMQSNGFKLHIDDFGTGYSSLSYLKKFPITGFKIDKSFIRGFGVHEDDTAIVKALISLGSSLGLVVTAEGVQTIETRDALSELGCTFAQGYLFAEPLPANRIIVSEQYSDNVTKIRGA